MTDPHARDELKPCPFCGAKPHKGLGKVEYDQLHGEPHQRFKIWCPHGCAKITGQSRGAAVMAWNTRQHAEERVASIQQEVGKTVVEISAKLHAAEHRERAQVIEECAKVAEAKKPASQDHISDLLCEQSDYIAAAIRALADTPAPADGGDR